MIDLKTNPDHLHAIASNVRLTDQTDLAHDLDAAAHDIKNLRDYAERIERSVNQMSGEIQSIRTQRDDAARALLAIFRPELEKMVDELLEYNRPLEDLRERVERLENDDDKADDIRREVREMIQDGDIVVNIDIS
jgi:predicted  nucleic acid-binding Zn-ribbon protein